MRFFGFTLFLIIIFSCSNTETDRSKLIHYIPENSSLIIKTDNLESLKSSINNNDFLDNLSKTNTYKSLQNKLDVLSLLKPKSEVLICLSKDKLDSLQYTIITKYNKDLFLTDSLSNYVEESFNYSNKSITKSTLNNNIFYSAVIDSVFFASSSQENINTIYDSPIANHADELEKIYTTITKDKTLSVIIKPNNEFLNAIFIEDSITLNSFTEYTAIDVEMNQGDVIINGITSSKDSTKRLINIFKNTIPQENQIQNITPSNSDGFMSFTFNNFKDFEINLAKYRLKDILINTTTTLFNNIHEVGVIYEANNKAVVLNSLDIIATEDALISQQNKIDSYRQIDIFSFSNPDLFLQTFSPLIKVDNATKYCVIDTFFVFSDNLDMLQNIIANYQNKTTLNTKDNYQSIKEHLSDASSLLMVTNPSTLKTVINKNFDEDYNFNLDTYDNSAIQFIYDTNFAHVNGIIQKSKTRGSKNTISEELHIKLETDLLNNPQFVTNHITKQKEIVVQDIKNNLYLISNSGKILWKKQLIGPVLGRIEQIDIYKNGRLQLAFATPNRVYVIDRNGNDVAPFPGKFNDKITQPLAVFDYDRTKNYRLLVTQGKNLLMYNVQAKLVNGFTFKTANNVILSQPTHFRIGNRDYITFKTENKLYILNRTGKTRVTPKTSSSYSNQPVFLYDNTFTTTTPDGSLISVSTNGNTTTRILNLSENHYLDASSKTLVTLNENRLTIKTNTIELDYGNYTAPKLFYINDKIYVSVTDIQSQKIYLFDSQAKLLPNFPIYGNGLIDLDNIDKDRNLEFVTKGESSSILLYKIN